MTMTFSSVFDNVKSRLPTTKQFVEATCFLILFMVFVANVVVGNVTGALIMMTVILLMFAQSSL